MRPTLSTVLVAVTAMLMLVSGQARAAETEPSSVEVLYLVGEVSATHKDGTTLDLDVGSLLTAGDTLVTGDDGLVSLRLIGQAESIEHDHMLVSSGSMVEIAAVFVDTKKKERNVLMRLLNGLVEIVTAHSGEGRANIEIETPTAVGGVRGTEFRIAVEAATGETPVATRIETMEGTVAATAAGVELPVGADFGTRVRQGEAPGPLHALPQAPTLEAPADGSTLTAFDLSWTPVDGAVSYILEIAMEPGFHQLAQRTPLADTRFAPETTSLPKGVEAYYWRVSVVDDQGFQGRPSAPRSFVLPTP